MKLVGEQHLVFLKIRQRPRLETPQVEEQDLPVGEGKTLWADPVQRTGAGSTEWQAAETQRSAGNMSWNLSPPAETRDWWD